MAITTQDQKGDFTVQMSSRHSMQAIHKHVSLCCLYRALARELGGRVVFRLNSNIPSHPLFAGCIFGLRY